MDKEDDSGDLEKSNDEKSENCLLKDEFKTTTPNTEIFYETEDDRLSG